MGDLRFAPPAAPLTNRTLDDGQVGRICYQASPAWELSSPAFLKAFLTNQSIGNFSTLPTPPSTVPPQDPRSTEDCLFLDVIVPQKVYNNASGGAPVIVWIYGGGYAAGEKAGDAQPGGLIAKSENVSGSEGAVFVAMNYRVRTLEMCAESMLINGVAGSIWMVVRPNVPVQCQQWHRQCRSPRSTLCTGMGSAIHPPLRW